MILIIEGTEGVGKTTLANRLAEERGWAMYRPLRTGNCWDDNRLEYWNRLGIEVNTYPPDLYAADLLYRLKANGQELNVVLDRSMISGLVYSRTLSAEQETQLLDEWGARMRLANARLLLLYAPQDVAVKRMRDPRCLAGLSERTCKMSTLVHKCKIMASSICTGHLTAGEVYQRATEWIDG